MFDLNQYLNHWKSFSPRANVFPWEVIQDIRARIGAVVQQLDGGGYSIKEDIAIHKTATIEAGSVIKGPVVISAGCFVGAHAYLRGGVFLGPDTSIGPGSEVKASIILQDSALAHFNFVGDSIIGSHVNLEAGAVLANHYNEREDKIIRVMVDDRMIITGVDKFGSLIGDHSRIGANAVLSPGTILPVRSIVSRLALVQQC